MRPRRLREVTAAGRPRPTVGRGPHQAQAALLVIGKGTQCKRSFAAEPERKDVLVTLTICSSLGHQDQSRHDVATAQELLQLVTEKMETLPIPGDLNVHFSAAEPDVPGLLALALEAFPLEQTTNYPIN